MRRTLLPILVLLATLVAGRVHAQSATPTETPTQTPTVTATDSPTVTATATATFTRTRTATPSPTISQTSAPTDTVTKTPTPTISATPSPTYTPGKTNTPTPTISQTPSVTKTPTLTPTPVCGPLRDRRGEPDNSLCNVSCAATPCPFGTPVPADNEPFGERKTATCQGAGQTVQVYCIQHTGYWAGTPIPVGTPMTCPDYEGFDDTFEQCMCRITSGTGATSCWIDRLPQAVAPVQP